MKKLALLEAIPVLVLYQFTMGAVEGSEKREARAMLKCTDESQFKAAFQFLSGDWRLTGEGMGLDAPLSTFPAG